MTQLIARTLAEPPGPSAKFCDPRHTAEGKPRARVALNGLRTLWFNTGTLCNLACGNCYIESTPRNDRLVYLRAAEVEAFLAEAEDLALGVEEVGFTGGEPFMNPDVLDMLDLALDRGYTVLVLTNAMRPMVKCAEGLKGLRRRYADCLVLRVSLDHFRRELHEEERGPRTWTPAMRGLQWLHGNGFNVRVAGRLRWGDDEHAMRVGFQRLLRACGIDLDVWDRQRLVLFPEMDAQADTPEITTDCWEALGVNPQDMMCASSRMVVKHKGALRPSVVSCTLLPFDDGFDLGPTLAGALGDVALNHPHCSRFCVLGGGKCSG